MEQWIHLTRMSCVHDHERKQLLAVAVVFENVARMLTASVIVKDVSVTVSVDGVVFDQVSDTLFFTLNTFFSLTLCMVIKFYHIFLFFFLSSLIFVHTEANYCPASELLLCWCIYLFSWFLSRGRKESWYLIREGSQRERERTWAFISHLFSYFARSNHHILIMIGGEE